MSVRPCVLPWGPELTQDVPENPSELRALLICREIRSENPLDIPRTVCHYLVEGVNILNAVGGWWRSSPGRPRASEC